jgi:hypothetical protein
MATGIHTVYEGEAKLVESSKDLDLLEYGQACIDRWEEGQREEDALLRISVCYTRLYRGPRVHLSMRACALTCRYDMHLHVRQVRSKIVIQTRCIWSVGVIPKALGKQERPSPTNRFVAGLIVVRGKYDVDRNRWF